MTVVLVTGASGHLGRLVVDALLERGKPAGDIVATARDLDAIADLAARGVQTRRADYTDPASLDAAFAGVDRLLLVSSSAVGSRVEQHANVVDAASRAGVDLVAYTSIANADTGGLALAAEHLETERLLRERGVPTVLLRNGWYVENYTENLDPVLATGSVVGSAGGGKVSAAARRDYAEAAAAVLLADDQPGKVYELGGDVPFTLAELAATLAEATGREIGYRDLTIEEHTATLESAGVPAPYAALLVDSDQGIGRGALHVDGGDLSRLIGRPTTSLTEAVRAAVAG
ncbi:NAD(P)H dehydrogenase (quinone) [Nocardioides thalensis]|uniref:NAD(P)H dehydrogenase (Quinone) n=1 Tax=Nocardioides thalensis TaxID=1914755 RepID=A0A853BY95_9ACTN|nr:NmrA family NAD(P)-binding protein [Nocardioides thalensis]NYI99920.1 NAD(P)H dehydrogenase (quinone) [Nocardioides thalensis]